MDTKSIRIDSYDYELPEERIARFPLAQRDACKLLVMDAERRECTDAVFCDIGHFLPTGALLVANNTRVINARVEMFKQPANATHGTRGARIEIFCLEPQNPADYESNFAARGACSWKCLVGNSKRWKEGRLVREFTASDGTVLTLTAERPEAPDVVEFSWAPASLTFSEVIAAAGSIPIPPYLNRESQQSDATDYQTVYSHIEGSVAAPTAGLHFTDELLEKLDAQGFGRLEVTLHVGAGTFRPVKSETIGDHDMHSEFITVERSVIEELLRRDFRDVIAVGTTSVRTLESLYHIGRMMAAGKWSGELDQWVGYDASVPEITVAEAFRQLLRHLDTSGDSCLMAYTRIIIAPGYKYRVVSGMITNFHQPKSTLLLLVSAFLGPENWHIPYGHALAAGYRFLSYGDACLFLNSTVR